MKNLFLLASLFFTQQAAAASDFIAQELQRAASANDLNFLRNFGINQIALTPEQKQTLLDVAQSRTMAASADLEPLLDVKDGLRLAGAAFLGYWAYGSLLNIRNGLKLIGELLEREGPYSSPEKHKKQKAILALGTYAGFLQFVGFTYFAALNMVKALRKTDRTNAYHRALAMEGLLHQIKTK